MGGYQGWSCRENWKSSPTLKEHTARLSFFMQIPNLLLIPCEMLCLRQGSARYWVDPRKANRFFGKVRMSSLAMWNRSQVAEKHFWCWNWIVLMRKNSISSHFVEHGFSDRIMQIHAYNPFPSISNIFFIKYYIGGDNSRLYVTAISMCKSTILGWKSQFWAHFELEGKIVHKEGRQVSISIGSLHFNCIWTIPNIRQSHSSCVPVTYATFMIHWIFSSLFKNTDLILVSSEPYSGVKFKYSDTVPYFWVNMVNLASSDENRREKPFQRRNHL